MIDKNLALNLIQDKPWHHDFEIIPGVRTNGSYNPVGLWNSLNLPSEMSGLSVADIGASNGFFSFEAYKRGAYVEAFDFRHSDNSGFGLAQYINGFTEIPHHHVNVLDISKDRFGQFDIVLALGLLYHVSDPFMALANCASLSRDRILIESYCINSLLPEYLVTQPIMRFISDAKRFPGLIQPNSDRSNFWGFTDLCLQRMVEDIGFEVTRIETRQDRVLIEANRLPINTNKTRLGIAYNVVEHKKPTGDLNNPNSWLII